jgi:hypothetical protein
MLGYGWTVPACLSFWRRQLQGLQNLVAEPFVIFGRLAGSRLIVKSLDSINSKAVAPFDYRILASPKFIGYFVDR